MMAALAMHFNIDVKSLFTDDDTPLTAAAAHSSAPPNRPAA